MWYDVLFSQLEQNADVQKAASMAAYMKNQYPFLGIPKPQVKQMIAPYQKAAAKESFVDWPFVDLCWVKEYREAQYVGIEYIRAMEPKLTPDSLPKLQIMIIQKPWWDTCDALHPVIGALSIRFPSIHQQMIHWSQSDNIWLRRAAINYQQGLKEKTDPALLEQIICHNLGTKEFFINKAIGWSLRTYSKVNPTWVRAFLTQWESRLSKLSIREASKYL